MNASHLNLSRLAIAFFGLAIGAVTTSVYASALVPDNGAGTVDMPLPYPEAEYVNTGDPMFINDGLPPGSNIIVDGVIRRPGSFAEAGAYNTGTVSSSNTMQLIVNLTGTGVLSGFTRNNLIIPIANWQHTNDPRTPFSSPQSFDMTLDVMQGQIVGDPDFDLLRVTAGGSFGMPSPGHTTLTQSGPNWSVDSFFDITYRIDFVGHPGSLLGGMSGSTNGESHFFIVPEPSSALTAAAMLSGLALLRRRRRSR